MRGECFCWLCPPFAAPVNIHAASMCHPLQRGCALSLPLPPLSPLPPRQLNKGKPVMVQYQFFVFVSLRSFLSASNWRMSSRREVRCLTYVHVDLPNLWNDSAQYKCFLHQHEPKAGASGALGGDPALGKNKHALLRATFHGKSVTKH